MIKTARSPIQAYQNCPRSRFLGSHYQSDDNPSTVPGLQLKARSLPLINGTFVHDAIAAILTGTSVDKAVEDQVILYKEAIRSSGLTGIVPPTPFFLDEQTTLLEGLVRAWVRVRLPQIKKEFDIVAVEKELQWEMLKGEVVDLVRCDALVKRRDDGLVFIPEYKTTAVSDYQIESWIAGWEDNLQIHLNTMAIEELFGEPIGGVMIEGMRKGYHGVERLKTSPFFGQRVQHSLLCYAFKVSLPEKADGRSRSGHYSFDWERGSTKVAIWQEPGMTVKEWVEDEIDLETLKGLFIPVPPIRPKTASLQSIKRSVVAQELRIDEHVREINSVDDPNGKLALLDVHFPKHLGECRRYKSPCQFHQLCNSQQIFQDPIGSGLFEARVPHHVLEADGAGDD